MPLDGVRDEQGDGEGVALCGLSLLAEELAQNDEVDALTERKLVSGYPALNGSIGSATVADMLDSERPSDVEEEPKSGATSTDAEHPVVAAFRNAQGPVRQISTSLRERLDRAKRGETKWITWEEMEARLKARGAK